MITWLLNYWTCNSMSNSYSRSMALKGCMYADLYSWLHNALLPCFIWRQLLWWKVYALPHISFVVEKNASQGGDRVCLNPCSTDNDLIPCLAYTYLYALYYICYTELSQPISLLDAYVHTVLLRCLFSSLFCGILSSLHNAACVVLFRT